MKTFTKLIATAAVIGAFAVPMHASAQFGGPGYGYGPGYGAPGYGYGPGYGRGLGDMFGMGDMFSDFDMNMRGSGRGYGRGQGYGDAYGYGRPGYGYGGYPGYGYGAPAYGAPGYGPMPQQPPQQQQKVSRTTKYLHGRVPARSVARQAGPVSFRPRENLSPCGWHAASEPAGAGIETLSPAIRVSALR